jgi:hypothetical protein
MAALTRRERVAITRSAARQLRAIIRKPESATYRQLAAALEYMRYSISPNVNSANSVYKHEQRQAIIAGIRALEAATAGARRPVLDSHLPTIQKAERGYMSVGSR